MFSYAIGQFVWMMSCAAQLVAAMGTGLMWVIQVVRLFCSIVVVWVYFLPHFWWYFTSSNVIYHVSYRSSETTRRRNLLHVLEAEGVDLVELLHREQVRQNQMRIHRSRMLRKRAIMMKAITNKRDQNNSNQYVTCSSQSSSSPPQQKLGQQIREKTCEPITANLIFPEETDERMKTVNREEKEELHNVYNHKNINNTVIKRQQSKEHKALSQTHPQYVQLPVERREAESKKRRQLSTLSEQPHRSYEVRSNVSSYHRYQHQQRQRCLNNNSCIALEQLLGPLALHLNPADGRQLRSLPLTRTLSTFTRRNNNNNNNNIIMTATNAGVLPSTAHHKSLSLPSPEPALMNNSHPRHTKTKTVNMECETSCTKHKAVHDECHKMQKNKNDNNTVKAVLEHDGNNVKNITENDKLLSQRNNVRQIKVDACNEDINFISAHVNTEQHFNLENQEICKKVKSTISEENDMSVAKVNSVTNKTERSEQHQFRTCAKTDATRMKNVSVKQSREHRARSASSLAYSSQQKQHVEWKDLPHEQSVHTQASPIHPVHHNTLPIHSSQPHINSLHTCTNVPRLCQEDEEDRMNLHNRATLDIILPVPLNTLMTTMDYAQHHQEVRRKKFPIAIVISGASWIIGSQFWTTMMARVLAARGYVVFCPDYRNFPQTTMEGMTLDVSDAIAWVLNNAERYNGDLDDVTLLGQSAGAHLTMMSLLSQAHLSAFEANTNTNTNTTTNNVNTSVKDDKNTMSHDTEQQNTLHSEIPLPDHDGRNTIPPSSVAYNVPRYNPRQSIHNYVGLSGMYDLEHLIRHFDGRGLYRNVLYQIAGNKEELTRYSLPAYFDECRNGETGEALPDNIFDFLPANMFFLHGDHDKTAPTSESANLATTLKQAQVNFAKRRERRLAVMKAHINERRRFFELSESCSLSMSEEESSKEENELEELEELSILRNNTHRKRTTCELTGNVQSMQILESIPEAQSTSDEHNVKSMEMATARAAVTAVADDNYKDSKLHNDIQNHSSSSDNSLLINSSVESTVPVNIYYALAPGLNHTEAMLEECIVAGESTVVEFIANVHNVTAGILNQTKHEKYNDKHNIKKKKASFQSGKCNATRTTRKCKSRTCALLSEMAHNVVQWIAVNFLRIGKRNNSRKTSREPQPDIIVDRAVPPTNYSLGIKLFRLICPF